MALGTEGGFTTTNEIRALVGVVPEREWRWCHGGGVVGGKKKAGGNGDRKLACWVAVGSRQTAMPADLARGAWKNFWMGHGRPATETQKLIGISKPCELRLPYG